MKMEYCSGLSESACISLQSDLENIGFEDVDVSAPASAKAGTVMTMNISATLKRYSIAGVFKRNIREYEMFYSRKAVARKVVNR